jgi:hypothetical protein
VQSLPEFKDLLGAVARSATALKAAAASGDNGQIEKPLGQVKVPYSKLFVKFG